MRTHSKTPTKGLCLMAAFMLALLFSGCGKRETSLIGPIFKIPPGILTKSGVDPTAGPSSQPPVADIFWSNTISERGYVLNRNGQLAASAEFVQFYRAITRLSVGANYRPRYHVLRPNADKFLRWTETEVESLNPQNPSFWINPIGGDFENQEIGPLSMIYNGDFIVRENLTIVVTDLEEQGLAMTLLADLIRKNILTTDDYAAAVIALKLPFNGRNFKPDPANLNRMIETRYNGSKPLYAVVSGPRDAVSLFIRRFAEQVAQFNMEWYMVTTTQKGQISPLAISDATIPQSAIRSDFAKIKRDNKRIMQDLWNIRTGRGDYNGNPDRIWNLQDMTDSMVDHFRLVTEENKLSLINELLDVYLLQYKMATGKAKDGEALWQLNVHFNIPQGCDESELEAQIKNYRYLTLLDPPQDKADTGRKRRNEQQNGEQEEEAILRQEWQQNDTFIARDLVAGKPALIPGTSTAQVYVAPKDMKSGALESDVLCFDLIVRLKKEIEIPSWVNDFDDPTSRTQDKTWNFKIFINNLLKGESSTGVAYSDDELIRIPIVLFNMPSNPKKTNRSR